MNLIAIITNNSIIKRLLILSKLFSERLYRRVFQEEMSAEARIFLKNLSYVVISGGLATLLSTVFMMLGGRLLGPEEYGKFVLIQSVALFLNLPMALGFNIGMLKYTSEKQDLNRQSNIILISYVFVFLLTSLSIIIFLILVTPLSHLFSISSDLFYFAIAFAGLYTFFNLTTSVLRGLNRMRLFSIFQVGYASIILISFFIFVMSSQISFRAMVYPMLFAYGITTIVVLFQIVRIVWRSFKWKFDIALVKILGKYAVFSFVGGLSYIFYTNIDRVMITKYRSLFEVGIYNSYYVASIYVGTLFLNMFTLVFFPTVSGYKNKGPVFKKINRSLPYLIGFGIPLLLISQFIVLKIYGNQYQINIIWMLLFAITSICMVIQLIYAWLLNSVGASGAALTSLTAVIAAVINVGLNLVLIPPFGITGAMISLMVTYLVAIIVVLSLGRKYFRDNFVTSEDQYNFSIGK
jgi:O-antigen/teichoic acid export membrane protein